MTWWLLALAHAGSVVTPLPEGLVIEPSAETLVQDAHEALGGGQFLEAAALWGGLVEAGLGEDARFWQGLAFYEAGKLRQAVRVLDGVSSPESRNLLGLVHLDSGRQQEGMAMLQTLEREAPGSRVEAHVALNLGLAWLDQGSVDQAEAAIRRARTVARTIPGGEGQGILEAADASLAVVALLRGEGDRGARPGLLSEVGDALRQGDQVRAQTVLDGASVPVWPRARIEHQLANAAWLRASGQLAGALDASSRALTLSRAGGLARETVQALVASAVVHSLAGRHSLARELLVEGAETARRGGYRVLEVDARCNLGLVEVRLGDGESGRLQADLVAGLLTEMQYPEGRARLAELRGVVAAAAGQVEQASQHLQEALRWHEARDYHAEAARVASALVGSTAGLDPGAAQRWEKRARREFRKAGDPLGEAHVAMARGLALVRVEDLEGALTAFAQASQSARQVQAPGAQEIAAIAEANAASALVVMGASVDAAGQAAAHGLEAALHHHQQLQKAMVSYDQGLKTYDEGRFPEARNWFTEAAASFEALDERDYALRANRGRLWAVYNQAVSLPPDRAWPIYQALQAETEAIDDRELSVRVLVAGALTANSMDLGDAPSLLATAAERAMEAGFFSLAARCQAALVEHDLPLEQRVRMARLAFSLDPDAVEGVYALYSVAVDAFNAGELELAVALAQEALPRAGRLEESLQAILDAASTP